MKNIKIQEIDMIVRKTATKLTDLLSKYGFLEKYIANVKEKSNTFDYNAVESKKLIISTFTWPSHNFLAWSRINEEWQKVVPEPNMIVYAHEIIELVEEEYKDSGD